MTTTCQLSLSRKLSYGDLKFLVGKGRLILQMGQGDKSLTPQRFRRLLGKAMLFLQDQTPLAIEHELAVESGFDPAFVELALVLAAYRFDEYKANPRPGLVWPRLRAKSKIIARAVKSAQDLINRPPNLVTPAYLAGHARRLAQDLPHLKVRIYDQKACQEMGLKAFLAVARGSTNPPFMIELDYHHPKGARKEKVALLGKGLTYDTGGLSLKPNKHMYGMKSDMAGAATVLGVIEGVALLGLPVRLRGLILTCENSLSGSSYRPGDVVASLSGQTIEIIDTDAEGRLTLADGLSYLSQQKDIGGIIDYATLTGSIAHTLGTTAAGGFTNNPELIRSFQHCAETIGDLIWEFPLTEDYKEDLESSIADLLQCDGRPDGIIAALFLREFLMRDLPWLHLDIAGTAFLDDPTEYASPGATGWGVWSTLKYLEQLSRQKSQPC